MTDHGYRSNVPRSKLTAYEYRLVIYLRNTRTILNLAVRVHPLGSVGLDRERRSETLPAQECKWKSAGVAVEYVVGNIGADTRYKI